MEREQVRDLGKGEESKVKTRIWGDSFRAPVGEKFQRGEGGEGEGAIQEKERSLDQGLLPGDPLPTKWLHPGICASGTTSTIICSDPLLAAYNHQTQESFSCCAQAKVSAELGELHCLNVSAVLLCCSSRHATGLRAWRSGYSSCVLGSSCWTASWSSPDSNGCHRPHSFSPFSHTATASSNDSMKPSRMSIEAVIGSVTCRMLARRYGELQQQLLSACS